MKTAYLDISNGCRYCKNYFNASHDSNEGACLLHKTPVYYNDICDQYEDNVKGNKNESILQSKQKTV